MDYFNPIHAKIEGTGAIFNSSKKKFSWKFELDSTDHLVEFECSFITSKRRVTYDGNLIFKGKKSLGRDFQYRFHEKNHVITIINNGNDADLLVDNLSFDEVYGKRLWNKIYGKNKTEAEEKIVDPRPARFISEEEYARAVKKSNDHGSYSERQPGKRTLSEILNEGPRKTQPRREDSPSENTKNKKNQNDDLIGFEFENREEKQDDLLGFPKILEENSGFSGKPAKNQDLLGFEEKTEDLLGFPEKNSRAPNVDLFKIKKSNDLFEAPSVARPVLTGSEHMSSGLFEAKPKEKKSSLFDLKKHQETSQEFKGRVKINELIEFDSIPGQDPVLLDFERKSPSFPKTQPKKPQEIDFFETGKKPNSNQLLDFSENKANPGLNDIFMPGPKPTEKISDFSKKSSTSYSANPEILFKTSEPSSFDIFSAQTPNPDPFQLSPQPLPNPLLFQTSPALSHSDPFQIINAK